MGSHGAAGAARVPGAFNTAVERPGEEPLVPHQQLLLYVGVSEECEA